MKIPAVSNKVVVASFSTIWLALAAGLILLMSGAGCGIIPMASDFRGRWVGEPGQGEAEAITMARYGLPFEALYDIELLWVEPDQQDCPNGEFGWQSSPGDCVQGNVWWSYRVVQVAYRPGMKMSETALEHELGHVAAHLVGRPDPDHYGPFFCDPGDSPPCLTKGHGIVGSAEREVAAAGY